MFRPLPLCVLAFALVLAGGGVYLLSEDGVPLEDDLAIPTTEFSAAPAPTGGDAAEENPATLPSSSFGTNITPEPGEIRGLVVDPSGGPVEGATVRVRLNRSGEDAGYALVARHTETVETDGYGGFRFKVPGGGRYSLTASATGFAPVAELSVQAGAEIRLQLGEESEAFAGGDRDMDVLVERGPAIRFAPCDCGQVLVGRKGGCILGRSGIVAGRIHPACFPPEGGAVLPRTRRGVQTVARGLVRKDRADGARAEPRHILSAPIDRRTHDVASRRSRRWAGWMVG